MGREADGDGLDLPHQPHLRPTGRQSRQTRRRLGEGQLQKEQPFHHQVLLLRRAHRLMMKHASKDR